MDPQRVLVSIMGVDQHEPGARAVSGYLRDAGMEVVYGGRFNTARQVLDSAIQEDVDVIGISTRAWEYFHCIDELLALMTAAGERVPVVVGGSVITAKDADELEAKGVAAAFGPDATRELIVARMQAVAAASRAARQVHSTATG